MQRFSSRLFKIYKSPLIIGAERTINYIIIFSVYCVSFVIEKYSRILNVVCSFVFNILPRVVFLATWTRFTRNNFFNVEFFYFIEHYLAYRYYVESFTFGNCFQLPTDALLPAWHAHQTVTKQNFNNYSNFLVIYFCVPRRTVKAIWKS